MRREPHNQHTADAGHGRKAPRLGVVVSREESARLRSFLEEHGLTITDLLRGRLADVLGTAPYSAIHLLRGGRALCDDSHPMAWPPGHRWTRDVYAVTCGRCTGLIIAGRVTR